jgi:hypothetical protein
VDQHVGNKPPRLLSLVRIVNEYLGNRSIRVHVPLRGVITEQCDLHEGDQDHTDSWWPAAVFLFVGTICVGEESFAMGCLTKHNTAGEDGE